MVTLRDAYAICREVAAAHGENFPVASLLLPRRMRPHVAAVYAFARTADDFADEGRRTQAERLRLLDGWRRRLGECADARTPLGHREVTDADSGEPDETTAIFLALGATIRECALPVGLFHDLLAAFQQDVSVSRYDTWDDLLDYCRRSANPVGRVVLRIAGYADPDLDAYSDRLCTALQLTNFWQDLRVDFERGRVYMPREEMHRHQAAEQDLGAPQANGPWRQTVAAAVARTHGLFAAGRPVCDRVRGGLRVELRATWLGGMRILERLEATGFDPLASRPRLSPGQLPRLAWRLVTWRRT